MVVFERSKEGLLGGPYLIKVRNFHLPYFGIMFERGPEFFQMIKGGTQKT